MKNTHSLYPLILEGIYIERAQTIVDSLYEIPRTGYKDRGVKNPETVGEHTDELVVLSETLFQIPGLNKMLKIHDWAESKKEVGDRRTDPLCPPEQRWTTEQKYKDELVAMQSICSTLGSCGEKILNDWLEFEERKTEKAIIAYQLDKYQMIRKAIKYQLQGEPVIAQEFIDHDGLKIKHPVLLQLLNQAIKKL
jgi:putative hydrolase of HD superfamily